MREIVLDTETTGLSPAEGDRLVEIGCIELLNHMPTGETHHCYVNPEMPMPEGARKVHGLDDEFLADKPVFAKVADAFIGFIGDAPLVIHNASFDMGFLNAELTRLGRNPLPASRAIDTVSMARNKFPGAPASLDALCRRFGIDNSARTLHGALLDAELLAEVYLELIGGRQPDLVLGSDKKERSALTKIDRVARAPRPHEPTADELAAHADFIEKLSDPLWLTRKERD
jgi:DNA polymerase-3 subunit epsilon